MNLKNWLRRLCKSSDAHVLVYAPLLGLQTPCSFPSCSSYNPSSFRKSIYY
ncbi:membrane-bound metallopeptidase [Rickettsia endosymbiont of Ixodes scapularis]|nr:membrane-bound metallopeptidase [Rickettsia endosymbiont of Ixodes scapularis]